MNATDNFVRQFLKLITDLFAAIWNFAITQVTILLSHPWDNLPVWKWVVIVAVLIVIAFFVWRYVLLFLTKFMDLVVSFVYMLPFVLGLGLIVWLVNFFIRSVHFAPFDRLG